MWGFVARLVVILALAIGCATVGVRAADAASSSTTGTAIYTTYQTYTSKDLWWNTCGTIPGHETGCFASGFMTPVDRPCGVVEDTSVTKGATTKQNIYVINGRNAASAVNIQIWSKVVNTSTGKTSITLTGQVTLPLSGGPTTHCYAAATTSFIFLATNLDGSAVRFNKSDHSLYTIGGAKGTWTMTADSNDDVIVSYGTGFGSGYYVFGPNGYPLQDGGSEAPQFTLNSVNAIIP